MEQQEFQSEEVRSNELGQMIVPDVLSMTIQIVNVLFVGAPGGERAEWVLIDAGMPGSADRILEAAEERYGPGCPPQAIILTHGHFDHVGALEGLGEAWPDVPIYAHSEELPYLTGRADYQRPDPTVGGGLVARVSFLFPNDGINLGARVQALPEDGSVPGMPGWSCIHTPGHTPGHISLFRETDRVLISGDAFITVKQESLYSVLTQEQELHGPPAYFTPDWQAAWESVKRLNELRPVIAYTGHGQPMSGEQLTNGLDRLGREFDRLAIPEQGRYLH